MRSGIMPTLIIVPATSVMAFSTFSMAQKGELPDKLVAKFPLPKKAAAVQA